VSSVSFSGPPLPPERSIRISRCVGPAAPQRLGGDPKPRAFAIPVDEHLDEMVCPSFVN